jgi:hypothetical protein
MTIYHNHHIIPKHAGGTDAEENIERGITVPVHADRHRVLFEEHGREQDRIAWQMLSGQIGLEEATRQAQSMGGKMNKGKKVGSKNPFYGKKHNRDKLEQISYTLQQQFKDGRKVWNDGLVGENNLQSKEYEITDPDGNIYIIRGLAEWCRQNNLSRQAMGQVALGRYKQHKNYKCRRIL